MKNWIGFYICFQTMLSYAQPAIISDIVSENKITSFSEQKLILIDFWATWCAPCVSATQQLEILQEYNKDKVFIISMSDEHSSKINKYLERKPIKLMVTSDFESFTFNKYAISSRPYAVLIDVKGNLIWKGHPSDMTQSTLNRYYDNQPEKVKSRKLEDIIEFKSETFQVTKKLKNNESIVISKSSSDQENIEINDNEVTYSGSLSNLFFNLMKIDAFQLKFIDNSDKQLQLTCLKTLWETDKQKIIDDVLNYFKLENTIEVQKIPGEELSIKNKGMLWDANQFDWEGSPVNFIVGNDRIQADNMTIKEVCSLLSKTKNINYFYSGKDTNVYDWDFQYLYDELMKEEFESSFGIEIKSSKNTTNINIISPK